MAMTSVCTGCACEEACGRMNRSACANRKPIAWRSRDPLCPDCSQSDTLFRPKFEKESEMARLEEEVDRLRIG